MKIDLNHTLRFHQGFLYGLRQPSVSININVIDVNTSSLEKFNFYAAMLLNIVGYPGKVEVTQVSDLIEILAVVMIQLQRNKKIAVYRDYQENTIDEANHQYQLIIPIAVRKALEHSLIFSVKIINQLLEFSKDNTNSDKRVLEEINTFLNKTYSEINKIYKTGQNYFSIVNACFKLRAPIQDFDEGKLRIGIGHRTQVYNSLLNSCTSPIGISIASRKAETALLLRSAGMPAPINLSIKDRAHLESSVKKIGFPVVIKPNDRERGEGVYANITDLNTLYDCYQKTSEISPNILLERHVAGKVYRFTLHNHKVVKLTKKDPLGITGDGSSTIQTIIDKLKKTLTKSRHPDEVNHLINQEAQGLIHQYGFTMTSVLEKDYFLPLRRKNNSSAMGKTKVLNIEESHHDNITLMTRVSRLFGLNMVGIDFIIPDIKESWLTCESIICDVNPKPQSDPITIRTILRRDLKYFGRIPSFLIITPPAQWEKENHQLPQYSKRFNCDGYCSSQGVFMGSEKVSKEFNSGFQAAKVMFLDQTLKRALVLIDYDDFLRNGLPLEFWSWIKLISPKNNSENDLIKFNSISELIQEHTYNLEITS